MPVGTFACVVPSPRQGMDRWFADLLGPGWSATGTVDATPRLNVFEGPEAFRLEAELPGVAPEDLELSVERDTCRIAGERKAAVEGFTARRLERPRGRFERVVRLPVELDAAQVTAELKNGLLVVTLPKAAAARPRRIQISGA